MSEQEQPIKIVENSNSLVARASQIMAVIIGLGLISMVSSMLVSESLSGDAEKINRAGQLRMLAVKVSRVALEEQGQTDRFFTKLKTAQQYFDEAFLHLFDGGLTNELDNFELRSQYQKIASLWQDIKLKGE